MTFFLFQAASTSEQRMEKENYGNGKNINISLHYIILL